MLEKHSSSIFTLNTTYVNNMLALKYMKYTLLIFRSQGVANCVLPSNRCRLATRRLAAHLRVIQPKQLLHFRRCSTSPAPARLLAAAAA
jgi:hypothetical protein